MPNYSVSVPSGVDGLTPQTGQSAVENATALGIVARVKGSRLLLTAGLAEPTTGFVELAAGKLRTHIFCDGAGGVALAMTASGIISIATPIVSASYSQASISSSAWYIVRMWWDVANASKQGLELYTDAGTPLIQSTGTNATALGVFTGFGDIALNYAGGAAEGVEVDWLGVFSGEPPALTDPTAGESLLIEHFEFNEGSGTTATGATNGWVMTFSAAVTWNSQGGAVLLVPRSMRGGFFN